MGLCYVVMDYDFVCYAGSSLDDAKAVDDNFDAVIQVWDNGKAVGYWKKGNNGWVYYSY